MLTKVRVVYLHIRAAAIAYAVLAVYYTTVLRLRKVYCLCAVDAVSLALHRVNSIV
jgi:hypothetical protein